MSNEILNSLLKEYSKKKLKAQIDLDNRKKDLYKKIPRLMEIEDELNSIGISTAKNILNNKGSDDSSIYYLKEKINKLKLEKENILKSHNIDINYLKPFYECNICNDTGYIMDSNYKTKMCSCLKQKLLNISFNKSNMSNLDKENFSTFNENLFSDETDLSKYHFNISPRTNIRNIKKQCINFVENFDDPNCKNLLFTGNTGLR